jgi:hypothetical protein
MTKAKPAASCHCPKNGIPIPPATMPETANQKTIAEISSLRCK